MNLPSTIRLVSMPSLVVGSLLLWTGIFFIGFSGYVPSNHARRKAYLYFGLTSLSLSVYSFASFNIYSLDSIPDIVGWARMQFAVVVPLVIFFLKFSAEHLGINNRYYRWVVPLVSLAFLPFFFWGNLILSQQMLINHFDFFGVETRIVQPALGPLAFPFILWCFGNAFYVGYFWARHFFHKVEDIALLFSFVLFIMAGAHDTLIAFRVYQAPYFFEFGFCGFLIAMAIQLFSDYLELNRQVEEKTQELEALNEEMRFLVGTISHDFMAPIISIHGFVDLLKEAEQEGKRISPRFLERIGANADHMKSLITDLTTFTRIGRMEEKSQPLDLKQLIGEVLVMLDLPSCAPEARIEVPEQWPPFYGSPTRLKQILLNLLQNAVKFGERDDLLIRIEGKGWEEGILITVEDNGPGIPEDLQEKVFETFFRSNSKIPGTGMGLSIIKKIVDNYGGRVWVDSKFTDGTRIQFYLPSLEEAHGNF